MPPPKMYVNDVDMSVFSLWVFEPEGIEDAPRQSDEELHIPGRAGSLVVPGEASIDTREFTVEGVLIADTPQEARSFWDKAKQLLTGAVLEVWFNWRPDRVAYARYQTIQWIKVPGIAKGANFRMTFQMANPFWLSKDFDVYTIPAGTTTPIEMGTAATDIELIITGNNATPVVRYRDAQGIIRGELTFDGILAPGQWIEYNSDGYQLARRHFPTGVGSALSIADIAPLTETLTGELLGIAEAHDGNAAQGPTLQALNCDVMALIRKAWA
jgi:hypothetical protein